MNDSIVDLKFLAENQPSLCIPRVFNNIGEPRIRRVFDELQLGKIQRIDIITHNNTNTGETTKRVFVHFEKWYWNEDAQTVRRKLIAGKDIKIVYDTPWFWKVSVNRTHSNGRCNEVQRQSSRPHIEFEECIRTGQRPVQRQGAAAQGAVAQSRRNISEHRVDNSTEHYQQHLQHVNVQQITPPKRTTNLLRNKTSTKQKPEEEASEVVSK